MTLPFASRRSPIKAASSLLLPFKPTPSFLCVSMASLFLLSLLSLSLLLSPSSASSRIPTSPNPPLPHSPSSSSSSPAIQQACKSTRFPDLCASQPYRLPSASPSSLDVILSAIQISSDNLANAQSMVDSILSSSAGNVNRTLAAKNCIEVLANSRRRTESTVGEAIPGGRTKDGRAWLSAALLYQYDCWSALKYANDTSEVDRTMAFLNTLTMLTSNALSMLVSYDRFGKDAAAWKPPATERDDFWEDGVVGGGGASGLGFDGGVPAGLKADATVCKDGGSGCYATVQAAVDAAPKNVGGGKRFVIHIKEGVYEETVRVPFEKTNLVFLGDGMGKTVITGSSNVGQPGVSTYNTATVGVVGDGFMATGLTIQNTAGPDAHQAVAFLSDSDFSVIENCEFLGNQDTLYAHALRQYYKSCHIEGNVDFIFGNSASYFQDCQILVRPRQVKPEKGENNAVTAHGRTDPAQSTGFVFQNCLVNGTEEYMALYRSKPDKHKNFLGRPWKEYSRTVFIECNLEALITPQGWMPWSGDFALKTLYYGEFKNTGPGSERSSRVSWSSQVPAEHVNTYSVKSFIQGDEWIPTSS
ncbi:LOW QUALITY PROTEIN: probable pectinesterase/pectinesterase inhibitor 51 [Eucalyptus grandis]|uniref:LOW QUALITY PROTEIN: probable pectinesterase/pectinesterase inhibitor 51 n=1 Tax=Eucalyptus grandis TaxID=71139 RepID=UPI00192ED5E1|nr:LOW QUALITY PROTEIN: probable pectinesterase/pectinesterase inhibitor 51 [Eucalyptus grandis]